MSPKDEGHTSLVTGATGFIGAHLAVNLLQNGHRVRALVRPGSDLRLLQGLDIEYHEGDLRDVESLRRAIQDCTALFHCAADYRLWSKRPEDLYEINVRGTRNLLGAAWEAGVGRTVYTSSVGALGLPVGGGAGNEETPSSLDRMIGHYKRSKFLGEEVAREAENAGMDIIIVNPSTPVGPGDIKPTPTGKLVVDFLNGNIPAYLDTGLNLIAVEDVAEGHRLAFEKGQPGRRYILGHRNMTLHAILNLLADTSGLPAPRLRIPYAAAYTAALLASGPARVLRRPPPISLEAVRIAHVHMFFDSSRAVHELGMPQSSVAEALRRACVWFLQNGYVKNKNRATVAKQALGL